MPEGVCEIAKVCYENWVTFVLLFVALGAPSFRCFPKSADIPPRRIMPKHNSFSCSFVFDRCLESLRKLFWGRNVRRVCEASVTCCENGGEGGGHSFCFLWPWKLSCSMFFGIRRHTTQTYYAPIFQCSICFFYYCCLESSNDVF